MKSIFSLLLIAVTLAFFSCESFTDGYDESPNAPTEASAPLLLSVSEVATFATYGGALARTSAVLTQHCAGTDFQMVEVASYVLLEGDNVNEWNAIYTGAMVNAQLIIDEYGEGHPYYVGMAKVLKALSLGILTDFWGDIPNTEALQGLKGESAFNPAYDSQESVIQNIQTLLTEAITELSKAPSANLALPGADDFIHGGDPAAWINTAWIIKARYANRLSKRDPAGSATQALSFLQNVSGDITDAMMIFGENANEYNQWFAFQLQRGDYVQMGEYFIESLKTLNDPRLPFYAYPDTGGLYSGTATDDLSKVTSDYGPFVAGSEATPLPLVTYMEALFIKAEASLRAGSADAAATAYNDAVAASLLMVTGEQDAAYLAANASETGGSITLEKIMTQKYLAMFSQPESWADWRRTGLPALVPNPSGEVAGIPRRLPTPQDERTYNANAVVVSNILQPVWWDQ